jgi:vacuole morphology and inheritance protein 14
MQLAADSELSVKNGAELLDRLVKDIVSESAASYVSVLQIPDEKSNHPDESPTHHSEHIETAFNLERFLPLLEERINVINPFTRSFLVAWVTLLDSIPDLELIAHLPRFLGGLFKFLSDSNTDVYTMTHVALDRFLNEIRKIARIKKGIAESKRSRSKDGWRQSTSSSTHSDVGDESEVTGSTPQDRQASVDEEDTTSAGSESVSGDSGKSVNGDGDWIPGQDVHVDHPKILEILVGFLSSQSGKTHTAVKKWTPRLTFLDAEEEQTSIVLTALRWINAFFEICPEDIMPFVPSLLSHVLPRMSHDVDDVRSEAIKVNASLMDYIMSLSEDRPINGSVGDRIQLPPSLSELGKELTGTQRRDSNLSSRLLKAVIRDGAESKTGTQSPTPADDRDPSPRPVPELDYQAAVSALTLQFLNEHEATRVAAIAWLIMLHRMAPGRVRNNNNEPFSCTDYLPRYSQSMTEPSQLSSKHSQTHLMLSSPEICYCFHRYLCTATTHISRHSWLTS